MRPTKPPYVAREDRAILGAIQAAGPGSHAAAIYEVIARGRINPMPFAAFYKALDRLAKAPEGFITEGVNRNRRVFTLTEVGGAVLGWKE